MPKASPAAKETILAAASKIACCFIRAGHPCLCVALQRLSEFAPGCSFPHISCRIPEGAGRGASAFYP